MNIKLDFITNSSTVCYCLYGTCLFIDDLPDYLFEIYYIYYMAFNKRRWDFESLEIVDNWNLIRGLVKETTNLSYVALDDGFLIGIEPQEMKEEETLSEFKEKVRNKLVNETFLNLESKDIEIFNGSTQSSSWRLKYED